MSKSYSIREAKPQDSGHILRLIKELAEYENMPDCVKIGEKEIADNLSTWYECLLLEYKPAGDEKTEVIGYSIWNYCFSTWRGRMAYLEDIYVSPVHRGEGLGYSLIQCVAKGYRTGHDHCLPDMSHLEREHAELTLEFENVKRSFAEYREEVKYWVRGMLVPRLCSTLDFMSG